MNNKTQDITYWPAMKDEFVEINDLAERARRLCDTMKDVWFRIPPHIYRALNNTGSKRTRGKQGQRRRVK